MSTANKVKSLADLSAAKFIDAATNQKTGPILRETVEDLLLRFECDPESVPETFKQCIQKSVYYRSVNKLLELPEDGKPPYKNREYIIKVAVSRGNQHEVQQALFACPFVLADYQQQKIYSKSMNKENKNESLENAKFITNNVVDKVSNSVVLQLIFGNVFQLKDKATQLEVLTAYKKLEKEKLMEVVKYVFEDISHLIVEENVKEELEKLMK